MASDAIVIGGGVMGLAAARALRQRGYAVTLLERAAPGRAASWASAGIIGATLRRESDPASEMRRVSRALWPAFAEQLQQESGLDPEYRESGCIHVAENDPELNQLQRVAQVEDNVEFLEGDALSRLEPAIGPAIKGGLRVAGGSVDPRRLCRALEISARRQGVDIETGVEVRAISRTDHKVTGVETIEGARSADLVVMAAGAWSDFIENLAPTPRVGPQRGQILALDQTRVGIKHVLLTPGDPYFVPRCDGRLVIGATREEAGWDANITAGGIAWLLNRAMSVVPALSECPIAEIWTGFRPLSEDGMPLIGKAELEGLYFLTGHGPSGIAPLPGSIALLTAHIEGTPPPVKPDAFDPLRFRRSRI